MIAHDRLLGLLIYDPETGVFVWRINKAKMKAGHIAGGIGAKGYWQIGLDGVRYYGHILAWFYMMGEWPEKLIDHEDTNRTNNRWKNLRRATYSQNSGNGTLRSVNKSGRKGVSWSAQRGKWQSHIKINGKSIYLGLFDDLDEAHQAYVAAAKELFGEFARAS